MIFVDTGYLWALLDERDQLHVRAVEWHKILSEPLLLTDYVLWELVNGFSARDDRPKAHATLEVVRSNPAWETIGASPELFEAGLLLHKSHHDKNWSLTDCTSFIVMRERGIQRALTHDHHFEQAGFEALLRRDPP